MKNIINFMHLHDYTLKLVLLPYVGWKKEMFYSTCNDHNSQEQKGQTTIKIPIIFFHHH